MQLQLQQSATSTYHGIPVTSIQNNYVNEMIGAPSAGHGNK